MCCGFISRFHQPKSFDSCRQRSLLFIKAATSGDLAQVRESIAAGEKLSIVTCDLFILVSSTHIYISLYHSIFFLTISHKPRRTIIPSMPHLFVRFTISLLQHRVYLWFCLFHLLSVSVEQKSPLFLTASFVISNHLLFISLYLSETYDNFSLSQSSLLIILYLYIYIYFSLFDKKLSFFHYFSLDLLRLLLPLPLSPITVHYFIRFDSSLYFYPFLTLILDVLFYFCLSIGGSSNKKSIRFNQKRILLKKIVAIFA